MVSRRIIYYRLQVLINIVIMWVVFAFLFLYNIILIEKDLVTHRSLLLFSLAFAIIGFIVSASLLFYLKYAFRHYPLWISVTLKMFLTFALFIVIAFVMLSMYFVLAEKGTFEDFLGGFYRDVFLTRGFMIFIFDLGIMTLLTILIIEVTDKYGPGGFWSMMRGKYNKPKIENRIFVFLDINDATTIAEKLGHTRYFRLLRDFFSDITIPILANSGEIYQYVGDEVIVAWKYEDGIRNNQCVKCFFDIKQQIEKQKEKYLHHYGLVPSFKAGIHHGNVVAGEVGIIKRDITYSGDVLNTTSRIVSMCKEFKAEIISSADLIAQMGLSNYSVRPLGAIKLKGKGKELLLSALA